MELLVILLCIIGYVMVAKRLSDTIITAPMVFIGLGVGASFLDAVPEKEAADSLHLVTEAALIILLFLDAAKIRVRRLLGDADPAARMLVIGLPIAVALGTLGAHLLLPSWPLAAAALIAAILAPTDAALGQAVTTNEDISGTVRKTIRTESGLNDGLMLPAVFFFASLLSQHAVGQNHTAADWISYSVAQISLGPLVGALTGYVGGKLLLHAQKKGLTDESYEGIGSLGLAFSAYLGATAVGGNGFIAAFIAGLFFGEVVKNKCTFIYEFTEEEGRLISWTAFFLLGLTIIPDAFSHLSWNTLALVLASLFLVRPVAVYLSLLGSNTHPLTRLFYGWFGPRGLATALFALLVAHDHPSPYAEPVLYIAANAVWISALLHGMSAAPLARLYARWGK
jgi:NhaP-type Na+/H+ or K+/H+ antiporter